MDNIRVVLFAFYVICYNSQNNTAKPSFKGGECQLREYPEKHRK